MKKYMTIQEFSERTGIAKSALRFYETKKLLLSEERSSNGYRVYADSQIATVKLISTLRLADVSIQEIQNYLHEQDEMTRQEMMKT
ncbi:MerR family transcriptional regulator [Lysinibacillus xylanilyticus]|uniref:helix-turn-helix domain-containing protein n=1 Tax=Lysinibacillus xylanilyticus TaxID=582475 RepID=UPI002B2420AD|nr:MerR family transcriptional regulator [Lysinibacillus xylanilyticus]MEB2299379.1 MerR family transcriptional regulator [Lysinibacillus xylanilyticus]